MIFLQNLIWSSETQTLPWAIVYQRNNSIHVFCGNIGKRSLLREKTTQQTIRIFVCSPLPKRIWIAKIHAHACFLRKSFMTRKFLAIIDSETLFEFVGNGLESVYCCICETTALFISQIKSN